MTAYQVGNWISVVNINTRVFFFYGMGMQQCQLQMTY